MSARRDPPSTARQLSMTLDPTKLDGMTQAERNADRAAGQPADGSSRCRGGERR